MALKTTCGHPSCDEGGEGAPVTRKGCLCAAGWLALAWLLIGAGFLIGLLADWIEVQP